MVRMNRESYIGIGVAIAIFLLVLPLVINNGLSHQYVSNSSLDKFNNYTGVTLSYYAAIFGGFVGGVFTYAGVKLSLDNQDYLIKREAEAHKNLLRLQLKYSHSRLSKWYINSTDSERMPAIATVFDKNWYTHLPYIQCLDQNDLENIVDWFSALKDIDDMARGSGDGKVSIRLAVQYTDQSIEHIEAIIDKLESDTSC